MMNSHSWKDLPYDIISQILQFCDDNYKFKSSHVSPNRFKLKDYFGKVHNNSHIISLCPNILITDENCDPFDPNFKCILRFASNVCISELPEPYASSVEETVHCLQHLLQLCPIAHSFDILLPLSSETLHQLVEMDQRMAATHPNRQLLPHLRELNLMSPSIQDLKYILQSSTAFPTKLSIDSVLDPHVSKQLTPIIISSHLSCLTLVDVQFFRQDVASLLKHNQLKQLSLIYCEFDDSPVFNFEGIEQNQSLQALDILTYMAKYHHCTDMEREQEEQMLKNLSRNKRIQFLGLDMSLWDPNYLTELFSDSPIQTLKLSLICGQQQDVPTWNWSWLTTFTHLRVLLVNETDIKSIGNPHSLVEAIEQLVHLEELVIYGCSYSCNNLDEEEKEEAHPTWLLDLRDLCTARHIHLDCNDSLPVLPVHL